MSNGGQEESVSMRLGVSRTSACKGINMFFLGVAERGAEEDDE